MTFSIKTNNLLKLRIKNYKLNNFIFKAKNCTCVFIITIHRIIKLLKLSNIFFCNNKNFSLFLKILNNVLNHFLFLGNYFFYKIMK